MRERQQMHNKHTTIYQSRSYRWGKQIQKYLDDYYLDGIIGLIPLVGNAVGHGFNLVYIYLAWFKLRSKRLTLVIILNGLKDFVLGLIPILGPVLDFFYKSNKKNFELIEQFAAGNPQTIQQIHQQANQAISGIVILCAMAVGLLILGWYLLIELVYWLDVIFQAA